MKNIEEARRMLAMAEKDLRALRGMMDVAIFDEEIFGFHAQQAVEKILKAWIALQGKEYPKTHDISLLLHFLQREGTDCTPFFDLIEYNAFAVQFRYEAFEVANEPLPRQDVIKPNNRAYGMGKTTCTIKRKSLLRAKIQHFFTYHYGF